MMHCRRRMLIAGILGTLMVIVPVEAAQSTTSLRGVIMDPTGAVIDKATVTLLSADNGSSRQSITDANGAYSFVQVAPGTYKLTVEKPSFATITRSDIKLLVNTPSTLDLTMKVSSTQETIEVTTEVSTVNVTDASVGNPYGEQQVRQLPLQTRNVVELLSLQPGVSAS